MAYDLWEKHRFEIEAALLDHGAELTLLVDRPTRTILAGRGAAEAVMGCAPEALAGLALERFQAPGNAGFPFRVEMIDEPGYFRELELSSIHGEERSVSLRILQLDADGRTLLLTLTDVSAQAQLSGELRRVHGQLQLAYQQLRHQQRALDEARRAASLSLFAAGLAHELNNPVAIALSTANTLAEMAEELRASSSHVPMMAADLNEMGDMSLEVKGGLSRVATIIKLLGELENRARRIDFDLVPIAREQARRYDAELDAPVSLIASSDPEPMSRFMGKVLENARRAAGPSGRVILSVREEGEELLISVTDSGSGVPLALRERIFDPFFTTQPPGAGLGLGLFLARRAIAALGGNVACEEGALGGARIMAKVPRKAAELAADSASYEGLRTLSE